MSKRKLKYLIDTSAVRPALDASTRRHCQHFAAETNDGTLWTSIYIRMEYIRQWFCEFVRIAMTIVHFDDVEQALYYLEQEFKQRRNKADLAGIASFIKEIGPLRNCRSAAEEFAGLALRWLKKFDFVFPSRITQKCGCQIGGKTPKVDYNHLLQDVNEFYKSFTTPVTDCEVNSFLGIGEKNGNTARLVKDPSITKLSSGKHLAGFHQQQKWITCTECARIGDAIIALEQPRSWILIHTDKSFNDLSKRLNKQHKQILSAKAVEKISKEPPISTEEDS